jgi:iron complex outermembrane receptor protein/hemoglobin/transferrin/lactoferrin receptor protein
VVDLRAGYRFGSRLALSVVFENVADAAYRVHGSSIQGPGRGVIVALSGGL